MGNISSLRNLGPVSQAMLENVGIHTIEDIEKIGVVETYIQLQLFGYKLSRNMLWALYGAVNDCDWRELDDATKQSLLKELDEESS